MNNRRIFEITDFAYLWYFRKKSGISISKNPQNFLHLWVSPFLTKRALPSLARSSGSEKARKGERGCISFLSSKGDFFVGFPIGFCKKSGIKIPLKSQESKNPGKKWKKKKEKLINERLINDCLKITKTLTIAKDLIVNINSGWIISSANPGIWDMAFGIQEKSHP